MGIIKNMLYYKKNVINFKRLNNKIIKNYIHINFNINYTYKWNFFLKILYLRHRGVYKKFNVFKKKMLRNIFIKFSPKYRRKVRNLKKLFIFDFKKKFFKRMMVLRRSFKKIFLTRSKKHIKIRTFIKKQKIVTHPFKISVSNKYVFNKYKKISLFFCKLPLPINRFTPIIVFKWKRYNNKIIWKFKRFKKHKINYKNFSYYLYWYINLKNIRKFYEKDYTVGGTINLYVKKYNVKVNIWLFWPIFVKVLYWRLYPM